MERELAAARRRIDELAAAVAAGEIGSARQFGGAGVLLLSEPLPDDPDSFYPLPRSVVTPYVAELSWLFKQLGGAFRGLIDSMTKFEFYGRLGNAANAYHEIAGRDENVRGLLEAVLTKARAIAAEMSDGTFVALPVAPGRAIAEDFMTKPEDRAH
jgi:hypothetical protein